MTVTTTTDWGLAYARQGLRVFPLHPGDKRPIYSGWQVGATTDPALIHQYWDNTPDRNMGIVTGETFDAWDIEADHLPAFGAWLDESGHALPEGPLATTGRGGIHLLTKPAIGHTRRLYLNERHIGEVKSTGGFIAVCPSVTVGPYSWQWLPEQFALPEAPDWLRGLVGQAVAETHRFITRITSAREITGRLTALGNAIIGQRGNGARNEYLLWAMQRAIEEGVPADIAAEALLDAYMAAIQPGENEHERREEGRKTIESAMRRESVA